MKCLVTGGAGFIGSHISQALIRSGHEVVVLDNLSLGSLENLAWKRPDDRLTVVEGDASDAGTVRQAVAGCEIVFHQAALPSVPLSVEKPVETNRQNLDATLLLLQASLKEGVRRFVFASSSAIYGDQPVEQKREDLPPQPMSPYALQKYGSERYGQLFYQLQKLETVSLRYFNVFGPRQSFNSPYSGVIAKFCTTMLEGRRPTLFGDGLQSRDFVYIDNVVAANLLAATRPASAVAGGVFNVAGGESVTLLQLVQELNTLTSQQLAPIFEPSRAGDVRSSRADLRAAHAGLAYQIQVSWQEGLKQTLEFYKQMPK